MIGGLTAAIAFFLIGFGGVLPSTHAGVFGIVISCIALTFSVILGGAAITNRLVVTEAGIVSWHTFRKRAVSWSSVRSFEVGEPRGLLPWPGLLLNLTPGRMRIDSIVGTRSFVQRVAAELEMFEHRQHGS
jgi:hypothetical protein